MTSPSQLDIAMMRACLLLAERGRGHVSPNPMVGAVLVRNGRILAKGHHRFYGGPHAEVECLAGYKGSFEGTTLYVNLEPCSHFGKTPPCASLLASTPIERIVVGMCDPNPKVAGAGVALLRVAGKRVDVGVVEVESRLLNRHFITGITRQRPYVHVKIAQSLDGLIAAARPTRRWISGPPARERVHQWRSEYDAVLVGAGTVRTDDPRLTARIEGGRNPAVVILDGELSVDPGASVFRRKDREVYLCTKRSTMTRRGRYAARLESAGVMVIPFAVRARIPVRSVLSELYARDTGSVLVEGGADVFGQFLTSGCVDELTVFIAPIMLGSGVPAFSPGKIPARRAGFNNLTTSMVGHDIMLKWLKPLE
jgi:diaminohydroxyphosphoribosylaminopyrimidine deaminase / 5-amino-6-(5-phosphoribosylamino)uracil reductase